MSLTRILLVALTLLATRVLALATPDLDGRAVHVHRGAKASELLMLPAAVAKHPAFNITDQLYRYLRGFQLYDLPRTVPRPMSWRAEGTPRLSPGLYLNMPTGKRHCSFHSPALQLGVRETARSLQRLDTLWCCNLKPTGCSEVTRALNIVSTMCSNRADKVLCLPCWKVGDAIMDIAENCAKTAGGLAKSEGKVRFAQDNWWIDVNAFRWRQA